MKKGLKMVVCLSCLVSLFHSCATLPKGAPVVEKFEKERYLGKWFEMARFDYTFERNLSNTTAEYTLREDGKNGSEE